MNFLKAEELALRIRSNEVSSREYFLYLLLLALALSLTTTTHSIYYYANTIERFNLSKIDAISDVIYVFSALIGTSIVYATNKRGDDKDFIGRYTALGFPAINQTILLLLFLYTITAAFAAFSGSKSLEIMIESDNTTFINILLEDVFLNIYFYWKLNKCIKIASHSF